MRGHCIFPVSPSWHDVIHVPRNSLLNEGFGVPMPKAWPFHRMVWRREVGETIEVEHHNHDVGLEIVGRFGIPCGETKKTADAAGNDSLGDDILRICFPVHDSCSRFLQGSKIAIAEIQFCTCIQNHVRSLSHRICDQPNMSRVSKQETPHLSQTLRLQLSNKGLL